MTLEQSIPGLREVAHEVAGAVPWQPDVVDRLVGSYFSHLDRDDLAGRDVAELTGIVTSHALLAASRRPGQDLIEVSDPRDPHGIALRGSTLVQVVTDDRPFLVDSVTMEVTRQGWSIREVYHPQYRVVRTAAGELTDLSALADHGAGVPESWLHVEVYPPIGRDGSAMIDELEAGIASVLRDVRSVTDDWPAMQERLNRTVRLLALPADDHRSEERRRAIDLLAWLAEDHFTLVGYREYILDPGAGRYRPVPGTGLGVLRGDEEDAGTFQALPTGEPDLVVFTKDSRRSTVHRPTYLDYVGVRSFDADGRLVGERRLLGLLSSTAYTESIQRIPVLATKAQEILQRSEYDLQSHGAGQILAVLDTYPRDDLFHATSDQLYPVVTAIARMRERRQVRLFIDVDPWNRFASCLVYLPRDRYNTAVRERMQNVLLSELGGVGIDFQARVSESVLARLSFVVVLPQGAVACRPDVPAIEAALTAAARSWEDSFIDLVADWPSQLRGVDFSDAYRDDVRPVDAVADLEILNSLADDDALGFRLAGGGGDSWRLRLYCRRRVRLDAVMPHLTRLGVSVSDERPYEVDLRGDAVMIYDFGLTAAGSKDWDEADRSRFVEAFEASYRGWIELGELNELVTAAGLSWVEVSWLRAFMRYLRQAGVAYSQEYVAAALIANRALAVDLVTAFRTRHDPGLPGDAAQRAREAAVLLDAAEQALVDVVSLDHEKILRAFIQLERAIVRTNAFAPRTDPGAFAIKLLPRELTLLPQPRPQFEICVYSPRVEGVHLRFGPVARGGLRWSDRVEDFRTEVLGLVKAQMVKNTVIVPVGAKGGFVATRLPDPARDRAAWMAEGVAAYRCFIGAMLSLTDTIVDGTVVGPQGVVRHDADDPYLVVAADKGTATFSDIANDLSLAHGFWLGDAFASGGSQGYDHKAMGITARGAWESVKRHFLELGIDCQTTDVTCVGIGDMSGDVFGNGMLLSRHLKLVAAFDHRHLFIDPDPDPEASFAERERLFALPRSSWADYDPSLLSAGGGVYARTLKSVPVTAQARKALGIADDVTRLSPAEYIHLLLAAPVDLLWNGGIGTYVKASTETHADVGDKANDLVRVNGCEVRARCAGEGGNLGWTQKGRIEYARHGGLINTDFIDNSAGVDTSDHEVNIKILLAAAIGSGELPVAERDALLHEMTDDVASLVLAHNVDQNIALANARFQAGQAAVVHEDWMRVLTEAGYLDRDLEVLPSSAEMADRVAAGEGLTSPELASLLAWTKIMLTDIVLASDLPDDPYLADRLVTYFPPQLRTRFADVMRSHRLHREIVTTVAVNRFVNSQGIGAYHRLSTDAGAGVADVIRAQLAARAVLRVGPLEVQIGRCDVDAATRTRLRLDLRHLVERGTRWMLHNRPRPLAVRGEIDRFADPVHELVTRLDDVLTVSGAETYQARVATWLDAGVPPDLARIVAGTAFTHLIPGVVQIAQDTGADLIEVAKVFFLIRERLGIYRLQKNAEALELTDRWAMMARSAVRDELLEVTQRLTAQVVRQGGDDPMAAFEQDPLVAQAARTLDTLAEGGADLARLSVALRLVRSLVH